MIGVFDSGVGGLTVLKAMREAYPSIDVVYFGDTKNSPYGLRSKEDLAQLAVNGTRFLLDKKVSAIVCACNSVSVSMALSIHDILSTQHLPIIEMVGPCVSHFKDSDERVLLVATKATIESGMYQNTFRMIGKDIQAVAIPELASAIEAGEPVEKIEEYIRTALAGIDPNSYDTLVLGCTHYPLAIESFRKVIGDKRIFDPAVAVAERVERDLWPREMGYGNTDFYISAESGTFRTLVATLFPGQEKHIHVVS